MLRYILFLSVHYLLWFPVENVCGETLDSSTIYDYNCDVQIDVVKTFIKELQDVRKREDIILAQISLIETKLQSVEEQLSVRKSVASSCLEAAAESFKTGVYNITLEKFSDTPFAVYCNEEVDYGGWLVIQRRVSDAVDFDRDWREYKSGFGVLDENYWIGLEKLHAFTSSCQHELYIEMQKYSGESYYARYSEFVVGSESEGYPLRILGTYAGTAGDSLKYHLGAKFTTRDHDNDRKCAVYFEGAWWFKKCYYSHLNGAYGQTSTGVEWFSIAMDESLKSAQMLIRPTEKCLRRMSLKAK
ncbi:PREDICTED: fibrinogen C domain-containing protein 1-like [Bactrocera latifrons]|uniref:fibrinogen C domain-containing protein 1-like n=1 Tax=Bactrocera latifrons TaxID=174628 RepID=UPI0008DEA63E|nr:PREDICTED: fibrinogen C domain-containing protein 1-like [Bactrocera latifrons]